MIRTWPIIGVRDVATSTAWYQRLFGHAPTPPGMITSIPNTGTMEFSLRDPDGYYVSISAQSPTP